MRGTVARRKIEAGVAYQKLLQGNLAQAGLGDGKRWLVFSRKLVSGFLHGQVPSSHSSTSSGLDEWNTHARSSPEHVMNGCSLGGRFRVRPPYVYLIKN